MELLLSEFKKVKTGKLVERDNELENISVKYFIITLDFIENLGLKKRIDRTFLNWIYKNAFS